MVDHQVQRTGAMGYTKSIYLSNPDVKLVEISTHLNKQRKSSYSDMAQKTEIH
jgi:uncharacterized protein YdbL (DUF1318 family)